MLKNKTFDLTLKSAQSAKCLLLQSLKNITTLGERARSVGYYHPTPEQIDPVSFSVKQVHIPSMIKQISGLEKLYLFEVKHKISIILYFQIISN